MLESWPCPATSRRSGTPPRRRRPTARRSSAWWWSVSWSTSVPDSERGEVVITWRGGVTTRHEIVRPVSRYESLGRYDQLMNRIIEMRQEGQTIKQIAVQLNAEGYRTPRSRKGYTSTSVRKLLSRGELTRGRIATRQLDRHEWWLPDLARAASNVSEQATGLGAAWLGSLAAGSAARPVGHLGRWAGTTAVAEAPGSLETGHGLWKQHRLARRSSVDDS